MSRRVLHVLSQRPGLTGSGVALNAITHAAQDRGWIQAAVVGTPVDDPTPAVGPLAVSDIHPLLFPTGDRQFALPGMSDVMPYPSSVFSTLVDEQIEAYCAGWREHIANVINHFAPDVIHSHHVWLLSSMLKDVAPDIPVVTHCHATGLRQLELCPHLAERVRRNCLRNDHFVVLHAGHAESLATQLNIDKSRISIVGSGFAPDVFHANGRASDCGHTVAYAGKLSRSKGVPWLLDAIDLLRQRLPDVRLHVAGSGSGPEADSIRDRMQGMPSVTYHGMLDQSGLADLLRASTAFVLPSFYEGLPLVLVEAAACGCRLVSTELPGVVNQLAGPLGSRLECVPLPIMKTIDEPEEADMPQFVEQLTQSLERVVTQTHMETNLDSLRDLTWAGVVDQIEAVWLNLMS